MKVTLKQLIGAREALGWLTELAPTGLVGMRLARVIGAAEIELDIFEKARVALIKELGAPDAEGGGVTVTAANSEIFAAKIGEMHDDEIQLPGKKLALDGLPVNVPVKHLMRLDWLLEMPEDEAEAE